MVLSLKDHGKYLRSSTVRGLERPLVKEQLHQQWGTLGIENTRNMGNCPGVHVECSWPGSIR